MAAAPTEIAKLLVRGGLLPRLTWAALAGAAAELAGLGLIAAAAWLIARAAQQPELAALTVAIVAVRAFAITKGIFRYGERLTGHDVALRAQSEVRGRLYDALVPARADRRGGDVLSRMVGDADAVQDLLVRVLLPALAALVTGVVAVVLSLALLPSAGAVLTVGLVVAGILVPLSTAAAARRAAVRLAPARGELAERSADLIHGAPDLMAYGASERALSAASEVGARLGRLERSAARVSGAGLAASMLVQGLTVVGVALLAIGAGVGQVATAVLALTSLVAFEPVLPLAAAGERFAGIGTALGRLRSVLATPPALREPERPAAMPPTPLTVEIDDIRVRHRPEGPPALDGVSLRLAPGRRTALIGPSGAGKSTLLAALMRFLDPESGSIRINGVDIAELSGDDVRAGIRGLTQDAYVFHASLRDNLRLAGPEATEAELTEAVRRARLLPFVERTGWETVMGGDGATMSGGQRQRLALARVLLADPAVVVLDEPTEALDSETADRLLDDLLTATEGRTTLMVTHRLHGLDRVDEIVVLDAGRVVQRGSHDDLLAAPGYYRDLWESERLTARHDA
ncbi:thiol reductant ABC exporter subunit CydC [Rhizohabitans arisaemae]|uniref:thiol reductant ABC exporter subunit CydC n=1 Tax=Rhizohabitans arisaemae TaxID=2720610 RepID=UPI0024B281CD|nr:thiol reductant ABC exporter subunit CydC [Rhizohabitans arisaemae]